MEAEGRTLPIVWNGQKNQDIMIPKVFHLCWLSGDPYPKQIKFCIDSWKKYNPDYEIVLWDTKRFDVNSTPWTAQAFKAGKYAFVADYIRLYAVYNYGGIYLDSDVEVIRSFDDVLHLPYFIGSETVPDSIEIAAFGAEKGNHWVKAGLDYYKDRNFIREDGEMDLEVQPRIMSNIISEKFKWVFINSPEEVVPDEDKFCIFPCDWFSAHPINSEGAVYYKVTENTHSIHHYAGLWRDIEYPGGPLHKLFYKLTGTDWRLTKRWFTLYGKK
ncbi:MAG: glycosyl transferase [Bacteroidales bacterium]|nr:glycosyl transferase [Bacteroidales bacterium]